MVAWLQNVRPEDKGTDCQCSMPDVRIRVVDVDLSIVVRRENSHEIKRFLLRRKITA